MESRQRKLPAPRHGPDQHHGVIPTTAQETKLAGIATGATANSADATLFARANHTGSQAASTISDFNSARAQVEAELCRGNKCYDYAIRNRAARR